MLLVLDIGNTNIAMGTYEGKELQKHWRISTDRQKTGDEYGMLINSLFHYQGIEMADIHAIIISSVVPPLVVPFIKMCERYFHLRPLIVGPGIKTGINLRYENPRELGSDRIANAVAAQAEYGGPCIFIDFGTATTFGAIDRQGAFAGGCICPGLKLTSEALVSGTAKLPRFELVKPDHVISRTTVTNLQAGVIYGYIGQVNYLVQRFRKELGAPDALVVATGGMARLVADEVGTIDKLDGILTLKGLRLIYERNR